MEPDDPLQFASIALQDDASAEPPAVETRATFAGAAPAAPPPPPPPPAADEPPPPYESVVMGTASVASLAVSTGCWGWGEREGRRARAHSGIALFACPFCLAHAPATTTRSRHR